MRIINHSFFAAFLLASLLLHYIPKSHAAPPSCNAAAEGTIVYNSDHKAVQFCNGTDWIAMSGNFGGGGTLPGLNSAQIWVGNGSNAAMAVTMSGDATLSNAGVLNITNNAIIGPEISAGAVTNSHLAGSIALSKLSATGTADNTTYLRGDGSWAAIQSSVWSLNGAKAYYNGGNVGIGTNDPKQKLHVAGSYYGRGHIYLHAYEGDGLDGTAYIQARDDSGTSDIAMMLRTQNAGTVVNAMTIKQDGNVGIGVSSPTEKLDVNGTVKATAFVGSGASLTALNASNLASGTIASARLGSGTADNTTFLRGDNTWAVPTGAGITSCRIIIQTTSGNGSGAAYSAYSSGNTQQCSSYVKTGASGGYNIASRVCIQCQ